MKILAIDIGEGTQDILVYDDKIELENSPKFILPSPTRHFAEEVKKTNEDLIIYGKEMGGGSFAKAIRRHQKKGCEVYMTEGAAKTIRNNVSEVWSQGVKQISEEEIDRFPGKKMKIGDLELEKIYEILKLAHIDTSFDAIAVAVQDHGFSQIGRHPPATQHARECRFEIFREKLETDRRLESFAYLNEVPKEFSRMSSLLKSIREYDKNIVIVIMDTSPVACLGALEDEKARNKKSVMTINIGNLHTTAFSIRDREICGFFEHHTHLVDYLKLINLELKLCQAKLGFEEIYNDGGHGAISLEKNQPEIVLITGPNRKIAKNWIEMSNYVREAAPGGDPMITGCLGLIKATQFLLGGQK
jgi:uncharacterized protein (DUF1786 family)